MFFSIKSIYIPVRDAPWSGVESFCAGHWARYHVLRNNARSRASIIVNKQWDNNKKTECMDMVNLDMIKKKTKMPKIYIVMSKIS